jgi:hypothetical protein
MAAAAMPASRAAPNKAYSSWSTLCRMVCTSSSAEAMSSGSARFPAATTALTAAGSGIGRFSACHSTRSTPAA